MSLIVPNAAGRQRQRQGWLLSVMRVEMNSRISL